MKLDDLKNLIEKIPKRIWILVLIVLVGIYFRTYHFHDWLVFNPDQARDAKIVDNVLNSRRSWLILGPEAGNTHFYLGPWFYHLEIISAKIFGNMPDKLAYPDLLFSILAIPLFYVFIKKYFTSSLSLALAGLYAVSSFAVRYSRFAWNPNSIPFFVLVYLLGILYMLEPDRKKSLWGAAMVGVGIGVGIQLHILLFFIMPTVTALVFLYLFLKKYPMAPLIRKIVIIFLLILITNTGQIVYEVKQSSSNTKRFFKSSTSSEVEFKPGKNLPMDFLCQAQANLHIISSLSKAEQCDFYQTYQTFLEEGKLFFTPINNASLALVLGGILFSLGGYVLLVYFWREETNERKKNFLALIGVYGIVTLAVMFPVIVQVEPRYYIVSFFLPFVFLGIMTEGLLRRKNLWIKVATVLVFATLMELNIAAEAKTAQQFFTKQANDSKNSFLGETETMAEYLIANTSGSKTAYLNGNNVYIRRYFKPLDYFVQKRGIDLRHYEKEKVDLNPSAPVFYVVKSNNYKYWIGGGFKHSTIKQIKIFGNVTIIIPNDH